MSAAHPLLPETAPFPREHIQVLNAVMAQSNVEQRAWLSGFLAGYQSSGAIAPATSARPKVPLTILYATESGNTEGLAELAAQAARKQGFQPKVVDMADSQPGDLADVRNLMVIASTWGEGDPPERAQDFYRALMADDAPRLPETHFSVLALGDSSYVNYCEIGRHLDTRLAELGGQRVADRVDCDLDFDEPAETWTTAALGALKEQAAPDDAVVTGDVIPFGLAPAAQLVPDQPVRGGDHQIRQPERIAVGQGDPACRAVARGIGADLRAGRRHRHRAGKRPGHGRGRHDGRSLRRRRSGRATAARIRHHHADAAGDRGLCRGPPAATTSGRCSPTTPGCAMPTAGRSSICSRTIRQACRRTRSWGCCASWRRGSIRLRRRRWPIRTKPIC